MNNFLFCSNKNWLLYKILFFDKGILNKFSMIFSKGIFILFFKEYFNIDFKMYFFSKK